MKNVTNKLQVRHFAQVPCKPFCVDVKDEADAKRIIDILAQQHIFLEEEGIIPDYSNAMVVVMFENGEWVDYWNEEEMMEFDKFEETYLTN